MIDVLVGDLVRLSNGVVGRVTGFESDRRIVVHVDGSKLVVSRRDCERFSSVVAGIDEVGRGSVAGDLVIGVAAFRVDGPWSPGSLCPVPGVKDSKKFKSNKAQTAEEQREDVAKALLSYPGLRASSAGIVTNTEIDEYGMKWAMREGISRALAGLKNDEIRVIPDILLLDGYERAEDWDGPQQSIPQADAHWWPVSAASILAKVWRDREMVRLSKKYPGYGFETHKGYGTPLHLVEIRKRGLCQIHRKSFLKAVTSPLVLVRAEE